MKKSRGFHKLTPISQATKMFYNAFQPRNLEPVQISIEKAGSRVTAQNIIAPKSLPPFNRSAMDGYALRSQDIEEASQLEPKTLNVVRNGSVGEGETREIWTGTILPDGADTVVMLEHTKRKDEKIEVSMPLPPGANVSSEGEDVKEGEVAVGEGTKLTHYHLGLLAALGVRGILVTRKPTVALIATGNELVASEQEPERGQITEVNSLILSGMCAELGAESLNLGITKDDVDEIATKIRQGIEVADIVLTTGGTSVGSYDLVPLAIEQLEHGKMIVRGIAMRPGMPTGLAVVDKKPVILLSGNPVAAAIGFEAFVRPLIQKMLGLRYTPRMKLDAKLSRRVAGILGREVFLRVKVHRENGGLFAEPIRTKGSGILTTLTKASGYVIIPEDRGGLKENEIVSVHMFDVMEE